MEDYKAWLPPVNDTLSIDLPHFPTRIQAVIFRLWEMVSAETLAAVLDTDEATVLTLAQDMGLPPQKDTAVWQKSGYITIIRSAWPLLPYEQLMTLLGINREQLAYILKEDDFLSHKLGNSKFPCELVRYRPLTDAEKTETAKLRAAIQSHIRVYDAEDITVPFDFFPEASSVRKTPGPLPDGLIALDDGWGIDDQTENADVAVYLDDFRKSLYDTWGLALKGSSSAALRIVLDEALRTEPEEYHILSTAPASVELHAGYPAGVLRGLYYLLTRMDLAHGPYLEPSVLHRRPAFDARYIYSYCGLYGSPLDVDTQISFPDALLREYARVGANGVWLQGVLYKLVEFPFDPALSDGYQQRLERLRGLIARAKRYGLKVYLYINEPRAMPLAFFDRYPDLKGFKRGDLASLCTSHPAVQRYLRDGIRTLCENAPGLGGFFTISVSENQTNCYSHSTQSNQTCPRCKLRRREEVVAEVNSLIADTAHEVDPLIKTIVWTWGWHGFGHEEMLRAISLLSPNCILQNTSEEKLSIVKAGVVSQVVDYTMSNIPPSAQSLECWQRAAETGHRTSAKVQLNTTWEGSTAPYIPVYENLLEYMRRLRDAKVENLQLSWTLGGYPSENLRIASAFFFEDERPLSYDDALGAAYGADAPIVKAAVHRFCEAFAEFPFHVTTLYTGPQNGGPSNLLFARPTGLAATMTCWAYDDLEHWRSIYPADSFEKQFGKLSEGWNEGLSLLSGLPSCEFKDVAAVCGALFEASYNQIRFIRARDAYLASPTDALRTEIRNLLENERDLAVKTYRIMLRRPCIGYEAANHYYFNRSMLMEKVINCEKLLEMFR
ncbi:MAG: hypothetical protein VB111_11015 [Clostridiaceae bacterium]|nr:hypothetical protein [Clostridiaceae bacterium]